MKKLALGCTGVLVIVGIIVVGVGYYGYTKVRSTVAQFAELGQVRQIEQGVRVKASFTPPSSHELTAAQVERFMRVQVRVRERLGADLAVLQRNYKALGEKKETTAADLPALLSAYRDMAADWLNAKRAQVDGLNEVGMSLDEYRWIRNECYRALDIPFIDVDFARLADQIKSGAQQVDPAVFGGGGALAGKGPASNLKLVERYRKQLEDSVPLAAFGL